MKYAEIRECLLDNSSEFRASSRYRNEIILAPDDRFLFILSDRPFEDEQQQLEANSIIADILNFEDPEPTRFTTQGAHGTYQIVDFVRV